MTDPPNRLLTLCRKTLQLNLRDSSDRPYDILLDDMATHVARLIERNLQSGRAGRVALVQGYDPNDQATWLPGYVQSVTQNYAQEYRRLTALEAGDTAAWVDLHATLTRRAYHVLRRFLDHNQTNQLASDVAQDVCEKLFRTTYPGDVPFDAWTGTILVNHVTAMGRSADLLDAAQTKSDRRPAALDEQLEHSGVPNDPAAADPFATIDDQWWLLAAIAQLPTYAQKVVIVHGHLLERPVDEIAELLDRTPQAVYNLRARALRNLRTLLSADE